MPQQLALDLNPTVRQLACERLARIVETTRNSFEREQYRRHRQAALKGLGRG
jgi:hypothetical protein